MFQKLKTVVMVSGNGSNLQAIINRCHKQEMIEIDSVVSDNPDAFAIKRAEFNDIPYMVIAERKEESREEYSSRIAEYVNMVSPDLIVMAGFMKVLTREYTREFPNTLNIHPSLLPKYRGLNTHQQVLDAGDSIHGITIHWVTSELDDGPIVAQASVEVYSNDTVSTLEGKIHRLEHVMYPHIINELADGSILWNISMS